VTTILVISDAHINSTVALCQPTVTLDDGGTYHASPGQTWIYHRWQELIAHAQAAAQHDRLVLVINGDVAEGDAKDRSKQLITRNRATIVRMAADLLEPLCKVASTTLVIRGTPAHGGKSGELEEAVANDIEATGPSKDVHSWFTLPLVVDGRRLDIAHKTSGGGLPWTRKQAANKLAARTVFEYAERRERLPDVVIRSHIHLMGDSYDAFPVRGLITPCFTLATEYITSIAPNALADIGAIFIRTSQKGLAVWKFHPQPMRPQWTTLPPMTCCKN
jgi:hypothetical protein